MKQQEIETLRELTTKIVDQINKLIDEKEKELKELEKIGIARKVQRPTLVYIPFYLSCYQSGSKSHYVLYPPSIVEDLGILTKFKGALGAAKIRSLFTYRSKPITNLLNQLISLIEKDPIFEEDIRNAGMRAHILRSEESRNKIKKGMRKLREEGWISEGEFKQLIQLL